MGVLGDDDAGRHIRDDCHKHHIDTRQLHITKEAPTSYSDVMTVKSTGRRTLFHRRGANMFLDAEHFDFTQSDTRILYLGYLLLLDRLDQPEPICGTVAASVLQRAQKAGLKTILDLVSEDGDRFTQIVRPALKFCDYCVVNEFEAERTTGIEIVREGRVDFGAARKAAQELLATGVRLSSIFLPVQSPSVPAGGSWLKRASICHRNVSWARLERETLSPPACFWDYTKTCRST